MATATEVKPRAPKAIAVSKLIGGKLVTELASSEMQKLSKAHLLCLELQTIENWKEAAVDAEMALASLIEKCG
jgi:hypothetical protein